MLAGPDLTGAPANSPYPFNNLLCIFDNNTDIEETCRRYKDVRHGYRLEESNRYDKSQICTRNPDKEEGPPLRNQNIRLTNKLKYLGTYITNKLNFKETVKTGQKPLIE